MKPFDKLRGRSGLLIGLVPAALLLAAARAAADPGDAAANQDTYLAVRNGARSLLKADAVLKKANPIFKGHRNKARAQIQVALQELDRAVEFAEANGKNGNKAKPFFDAGHGKEAASQTRHGAIRAGANNLIAAGNHLDAGLDIFGGHRVNALRAIHRALDQLDLAIKAAD
jgi:hypothetical protein